MTSVPDGPLRIVVPDDAPPAIGGSSQEAALQALGELHVYDSLALSPDSLLERIRDAHIAICIRNSSQFTAEVLEQCASMRHIVVFGIGVDMVDVEACRRLGILVTNTPGYSAPALLRNTPLRWRWPSQSASRRTTALCATGNGRGMRRGSSTARRLASSARGPSASARRSWDEASA